MKVLIQAIDAALRSQGFAKSGMLWRNDIGDLVYVVELQRSTFGAQYYINCGICAKELVTDVSSLKENQCHVRLRLTDLVAFRADLELALDKESKMADSERANVVENALLAEWVPLVSSVRSVADLANLLRVKTLFANRSTMALKNRLGVQS